MEERDDERKALIHEFYQIYRPLQKIRDLRLHSLLAYIQTTTIL